MATAIVRKAFEDQNKPGFGPLSYMPTLDKFLLKAFNRLSYNCEVNGLLIAEFLLDLLDYYTLNAPVKSTDFFVLKTKFLLLISGQNFNTTNDVAHVNDGKMQSYSIFEHYQHRGLCFLQLLYYRVVSIVKHGEKLRGDYEFDDTHAQKGMFPQ